MSIEHTDWSTRAHEQLVPVANAWNEAIGLDVRYARTPRVFIARCPAKFLEDSKTRFNYFSLNSSLIVAVPTGAPCASARGWMK